jgi:hypothetical protein
LTNEALLRVVVILTGRYSKVIRGGKEDWGRQIWRGLAIVDRQLEIAERAKTQENVGQDGTTNAGGYAIDQAKDDDLEEEDEDDGLLLSAFEAMDATEAFKHGEESDTAHAMIPTDNFLTLIMFLLLIAPLAPQEPIAKYTDGLTDEKLLDLRQEAYSILVSFGVERNPGISYKVFRRVVSQTMPNLFNPLTALFEHFFFDDEFEPGNAKRSRASIGSIKEPGPKQRKEPEFEQVILPESRGELLTQPLLSHISFIIPPSQLFGNLTLLYSGASNGFSMPTLQTSVFNWHSPSLLLVGGTIIDPEHAPSSARSFLSSIPYRKFRSSTSAGQRVIYGAYIPVAWKQTHKTSFSTNETRLFQLWPQHDLFPASTQSSNYAYFLRQPSSYTGIGFGSPLPENNHSRPAGAGSRRRSSLDGEKLPLGPVSLHMEDSLTYAAFTNDSRGTGSFLPSKLPRSCRLEPEPSDFLTVPSTLNQSATTLSSPVTSPMSPGFKNAPSRIAPVAKSLIDWQDVFEIDALEVYGLGGEEVAEQQKQMKQWEEREAERRRGVNMRTGDIDADRELLKLAGLIGEGRSGGSMG